MNDDFFITNPLFTPCKTFTRFLQETHMKQAFRSEEVYLLLSKLQFLDKHCVLTFVFTIYRTYQKKCCKGVFWDKYYQKQ